MNAMMSSSPPNGAAKNKTKLSVASLLNTAGGDRTVVSEQLTKAGIVSISSENLRRDVATSAPSSARSLPTVANSELLYKSISSTHSPCPSGMPPLAPTRPQMVVTRPPVGVRRQPAPPVNYSVQEIYNEHGFIGYSNVSTPISQNKTLINNVTIPIENSQHQGKTMHSNVNPSSLKHQFRTHSPASNISYSRLTNSPVSISSMLTDSTSTISGDESFTNFSLSNISNKGDLSPDSILLSDFQNQDVIRFNSRNVISPTSCSQSVPFSSFSRNMRGTVNDTSASKMNSNLTHFALVPKGWTRVLEKGYIIYISPNKSRIKSYDDMIDYLESDGTCKCGLECPVKPSELFSFNPKVPSKLSMTNIDQDCERDSYCSTCKEFKDLLTESLIQKRARRGRRRGRTKSSVEEEEHASCDRKKILLTGASPLEMFQSGMEAINALSQFKILTPPNQSSSLPTKFTTKTVASSASKASSSSDSSIQVLSNSLPGGARTVSIAKSGVGPHLGTVANNGSKKAHPSDSEHQPVVEKEQRPKIVSLPSSVIYSTSLHSISSPTPPTTIPVLNAVQSSISLVNSPQAVIIQSAKQSPVFITSQLSPPASTKSAVVVSSPNSVSVSSSTHSATNVAKSESVDMPFPSSLMGNKKRIRKTKPKTSAIDSFGDIHFTAKKKAVKKVLPDVDIKKASELQLHEYLHHPTYILNQSSIHQSNDGSLNALKGIHVDTAFSSRPQIIANQPLSKDDKSTVELQDIYGSLHVGVMNQQPSPVSFSKPSVISACYPKTNLSSALKEQPPPNRTVSSTNQLPEALVNQLGYKFTPSPSKLSSADLSSNSSKSVAVSSPKTGNCSVSNLVGSDRAHSITNPPLVTSTERSCHVSIISTNTTSVKSEINDQPVNRPLQNVSISQSILTTIGQVTTANAQQMRLVQNVNIPQNILTTASQATTANGQHMVLLQLVTQNNSPGKSTLTKVSNPIVRAYSVSQPQAYMHTQGQSKFVLMGKNNASQTLATLAMQCKANGLSTPPIDATKQTLQIQNLISVPTNASQISPGGVDVSHAVPMQYVTTVNHPGLPIGNQNLEASYPVMQYIPPTRPAQVSYVYPATCATVIRPTISTIANTYVRIAPAMQPITTAINFYEIEKQKKEQELLDCLQEQLMLKSRETSSNSPSPATLSTSPAFLTMVTLSPTKITHKISPSMSDLKMTQSLSPDASSESDVDFTSVSIQGHEISLDNIRTANSNSVINVTPVSSNIQTMYSLTPATNQTFTTQLVSVLPASNPTTSACIPSAVIRSPHALSSGNAVLLANSYASPSPSSKAESVLRCSVSPFSTAGSPPNGNDLAVKQDLADEIGLQCNEKSSDLSVSGDESKRSSPENECTSPANNSTVNCCVDSMLKSSITKVNEGFSLGENSMFNACVDNMLKSPISKLSDTFNVGELVWVKIAGYPSWPGRVVSYLEAKKPKLIDGRVYVSWFGSNQVNAVDLKQLKSFDEGFKGLDGNLTKRGYRANKKQLNELEKAIAAALEHSERNQVAMTHFDEEKFDVALNSDLNDL